MRKKIVAGNWKMNNTLEESKELAQELVKVVNGGVDESVEIAVCPPFINLQTVNEIISKSDKINLGAQNCHEKASGAYTGEISISMLNSIGTQYVILGHSERREYFKESDELIASKVDAVLANNLKPIFCCGETLPQREAGIHFDFVKDQVTKGLFHLSPEDFKKVVIAYEPIWAIGTGVTASSSQAQEMHDVLRQHIASKYGKEAADEISILYGGSCKPSNAKEIFACPDVDGGLIGGASLNAQDFISIENSFE